MTAPFDLLDTPLEPGVTLLEASAGTGKTYALAAIYLRLIAEEKLTVGQIAVTTYTIPATAELRERIRARLTEAVAAFDGAPAGTPFVADLVARHSGDTGLRQRLSDAVRDFDEACISTIHGFCQRTLRERAFESGAAPDAELIPDQSELVREVAEDFWRHHFSAAAPGPTPLALLAVLTPDTLARLYTTTSSQALARLIPDGESFPTALNAVETLLAQFRAQWRDWREVVHRIFVDDPSWAIGSWKDLAATKIQFAHVEELAAEPSAPLSCYQALDHFRPTHISAKKGISARTPLPAHPFMAWCEEFAAATAQFAAATRAKFLVWARDELAQRKAARGVLGFDDLLAQLHAALHGPGGEALVEAVHHRFAASLVDEFQDTDPIQDAIFHRFFAGSPAHRLFLIGDPKQAIYAFRGADLFTYLAARQRADRRYALDTNHRSDAPLIEAVNHLFSRPESPFADAIEFESVRAARPEAPREFLAEGAARAPMRFLFWENEEAITTTSADRELPSATAASIARLLARGTLEGRPLRPSDIAVLCWKNRQCQAVQAALTAQGIPAVVLNSSSVLHSAEASELHVLLVALARPSNEAGVRAALATSLLGWDAAAIDRLGDKAAEWETLLGIFTTAHVRWRDHGFIQMFRALLRDLHARPRLLALPGGERRLTNFLHLAELLHAAAREFSLGPAALVRWLASERQAEMSGEEHELRLETDEDAVKVLTIHKSKGLEWPVVFCPFLWTKAALHEQAHTLFHDESGQAFLDLGSPAREEAERLALRECLSEHLRLLYVALTRARHECHVVWGKFNRCECSSLTWLLEPPPAGSPVGPETLVSHATAFDSAHLRNTVEQLAVANPEYFSVEELDFPGAKIPQATASTENSAILPPTLAPRSFTGRLNRTWRVSSFSSLAAGTENEHDRDADDRPRVDVASLRGIHAFPRGAKPGVCLHEIFESLDFSNDDAIDPLVAYKLRQHDLFSPEQASALSETVRHTLAARLGQAELRSISRSRTLREMEFHLPAGLLTPAQMAAAIGIDLHFEPQRGILKGFIDLVFEHEGRYHLVDWKSNWLGATSAEYTEAAVAAEMERHRYSLQWRLYMLALHRYLRLRLKDYSPERHLGEVYYLFVRGITPDESLGVFHAQPDLAELAELSSLFPSP